MQPANKKIPFTPEKYREMQKKVADLEALREVVMERLVTAREMGDLSENGAYKYAKFELGDIGRQLKRFKRLLADGFPAPKHTGPKGNADFGSQVTIEKCDDSKKQISFTIVSKHESDPTQGKLAYTSPMGKAVMRRNVGDTVSVITPGGVVEFTLLEIK